MLLCIEYGILFVDTVNTKIKACNAFNAMFVDTVDTGVCGSLTTPARREGYCIVWGFRLGDLAVHQSEEAALLTFLDLSNYKGDCRQDAQPIPNS